MTYFRADDQKYNRSHEDASEEDLKALRYTDKPKKEAEPQDDEPVEDKLANLTVAAETEDPFKDVPVLSRTKAELYLFDTETDVFVIQEKEVDVDMASNGDYDSEFRRPVYISRTETDVQLGSLFVTKRHHSSRYLLTRS